VNAPHGLDRLLVLLREAQLVGLLEVQPELGCGAERRGEAQRGVGRDRTLLGHDPADPVGRDADGLREAVGAQVEREKELLTEHFPRMDGTHGVLGVHVALACRWVCGSTNGRQRNQW
jgi:hypothetical protein